MKNKRHKSSLFIAAWVILLLVIALLGYLIYCYVRYCQSTEVDFSTGLGSLIEKNPGDFLWGTGGILLTFVSSLLLIVTFNEQRKQFEEQYRTEYVTRFENTFFNLMSMFYNVRQSLNESLEKKKRTVSIPDDGQEKTVEVRSIEEYAVAFIDKTRRNQSVIELCEDLKKEEIPDTERDNIKNALGENFETYNADLGNPLSYYFRYLYNLINYVLDYWQEDKAQIDKYLNFIQSQMSDAELCLVFYNCMSRAAKDSNYKYSFFSKINELNFLQNINEEWLIDPNNHLLYDKTRFRFLNRTQLEGKDFGEKRD